MTLCVILGAFACLCSAPRPTGCLGDTERRSPAGSAADVQGEIVVFAAASLQDVLKELSKRFERAHAVKLAFHFAGSQELARHIETAHGADVFLSASEIWMDRLERGGHLAEGTRRTFLSNRLVVVANPALSLVLQGAEDLARAPFEVLALGDPRSVPVGMYAKDWLERTPMENRTAWDLLEDRVVPTANARAALAMVEAHGAAVGIVYRTDVMRSTRVKRLYEVPEDTGPVIRYAAAALAGRPRENDARAFVAFLSTPDAQEHFAKEGFVLP